MQVVPNEWPEASSAIGSVLISVIPGVNPAGGGYENARDAARYPTVAEPEGR